MATDSSWHGSTICYFLPYWIIYFHFPFEKEFFILFEKLLPIIGIGNFLMFEKNGYFNKQEDTDDIWRVSQL